MSKIPKTIIDLAAKIENKEKEIFLHEKSWRNNIPNYPGVYMIWRKSGTPIYIGETSNLKDRFKDLHQTAHHTFRRHLKKKIKACKKLPGKELSNYISNNYRISYMKVNLGRSELEEYLIQFCFRLN